MKIHVIDDVEQYKILFISLGFEVVSLERAEMICFTGGADVSPDLYDECKHTTTSCSISRDDREVGIFDYALANDILMVGICRGAQFLHVMNGGKLWQNVGGHAIGHPHLLKDIESGEQHSVTSTHHQMMKFGSTGLLVAVANEAKFKECMGGKDGNVNIRVPCKNGSVDAEVMWHGDSNCLCFQPHPEFNAVNESADSTKLYFKNLLTRFFDIK